MSIENRYSSAVKRDRNKSVEEVNRKLFSSFSSFNQPELKGFSHFPFHSLRRRRKKSANINLHPLCVYCLEKKIFMDGYSIEKRFIISRLGQISRTESLTNGESILETGLAAAYLNILKKL